MLSNLFKSDVLLTQLHEKNRQEVPQYLEHRYIQFISKNVKILTAKVILSIKINSGYLALPANILTVAYYTEWPGGR